MSTKTSILIRNRLTQGAFFLLITLLLFFSLQCQKDGDDPQPSATEVKTATLGTDGGSIQLESGIQLVIPPGALSSSVNITLSKYKPEDYFSGNVENRIVIGCTPDDLTFLKAVTIYFPVPESLGSGDFDGLAGWIYPESGAVEVYPSTKDTVEGKRMLKIETTHFSKYEGSFWQYPPNEAAILEIPHYNQGQSPYCWAACIKMICEAVKHTPSDEMHGIIGYMDVSEGGIEQYDFRFNPKVAQLFIDRIGMVPDRQLFPIGSAYAMDGYIRDRLALGYPVIVYTPVDEHAFVVVGYKGNTYYINDPASIGKDGNLCYETKTWAEFKVDQMEINAKFVTVSIPVPITCSGRLHSINIGPKNQFYFQMPGGGVPNQITYEYDYTKAQGYKFLNYNNVRMDTLPSTVVEIGLFQVELANTSRSQNKSITARSEVISLKDPAKHYYSTPKTIQVNANSMARYAENIPMSDLTKDLSGVEEFQYKLIASDESGDFDDFTINFKLAAPQSIQIGFKIKARDKGDGTLYNESYAVGSHAGVYSGNTFTFLTKYAQGGSDFTFSGSAELDASKTNLLTLTYTYDVRTNQADPLFGAWNESSHTYRFENIPLTPVGNKLQADLSGNEVCGKLNVSEIEEWFNSESLGLIDLDVNYEYLCDTDSFLSIELPKP